MRDELTLAMDKVYEAMIVYFADAEDDELVPVGQFIIDVLGNWSDYPTGIEDVFLPAGHVRERARIAREELLRTS